MFDNLDFPNSFETPAGGLADVEGRARSIKHKRRVAAVSVGAFAIAGLVMVTAALAPRSEAGIQTGNAPTSEPRRVTTTTIAPDSTTVPSTRPGGTPVAPGTDTEPDDPNSTPIVPPGAPGSETPGDATPGDKPSPAPNASDWSNLRVSWDAANPTVTAGATTTIGYTVTNTGSFAVDVPDASCTDDLTVAATAGTVWPAPTSGSAQSCTATGTRTIAAGASVRYTDSYVAGMVLAGGTVHPAAPGDYAFEAKPWHLTAASGPTTEVTITAPAPVPFVVSLSRNEINAKSNAFQTVMINYENNQPYEVRVFVAGPCFTDGSADPFECVAGGMIITAPPMHKVQVNGRVWARNGFSEGGAALGVGTYSIALGNTTLPFYVSAP